MNEKKAKLLRKTVYGNANLRLRSYITLETGQVVNSPGTLRQIYQGTKKLYKEKKNDTGTRN